MYRYGISQTVENAISCCVEELFFHKFLDQYPDADVFLDLITFSLSTDTSLVKCSWSYGE